MSFKDINSYDNLVDFVSQPKNINYKSCDEELAIQKEDKNIIFSFNSLSKSYNNLTELVSKENEITSSDLLKENYIEIKSKPKRREREMKFDELSKSPNISDILKKYRILNVSSKNGKSENDDYFLNYD